MLNDSNNLLGLGKRKLGDLGHSGERASKKFNDKRPRLLLYLCEIFPTIAAARAMDEEKLPRGDVLHAPFNWVIQLHTDRHVKIS